MAARHPQPRGRRGHAARPDGRPARVRAALRPPRRRGVLARLPDGRDSRRRPRTSSQEAFLSIWRSRLRYDADARQRAHVGARDRPQPRDRRAAAQHRSTSAGARRSRASRSATRRPSGPTWRSRGARRRAACASALDTLPDEQRRTIELAYFGGFTPQPDRRDARRAGRHGQGTDAARARQDAATSWPRRRGMTRDHAPSATTWAPTCSARWTSSSAPAFERHLRGCDDCRDEVERLRPAADALPRSVEQVEPPPSLKRSLMEVVEREARARRRGAEPRAGGSRPALVRPRRRGGRAPARAAWSASASRSSAATRTRTVAVTVDKACRGPGGQLDVQGDGTARSCSVHDMPDLRGRARLPGVGAARRRDGRPRRPSRSERRPRRRGGCPRTSTAPRRVRHARAARRRSTVPSERPDPERAAVATAGSPLMEICYRHPNRETGVRCSNCERPICPDCMTSTSVGMRCPECARQRTQGARR